MTELYNDEYYLKINVRRIKYLFIYVLLLIFSVALETGLLIYYSTRPFGTPLETPLLIFILTYGGLFTAFSVVYLTIPYGRLKKYRDIVIDFLDNDRIISEATVISIDENLTVKYGVDFYRINLLEWSDTENDYFERSILVDNELKNLDVKIGDILKISTTANMLVAYEIISRKFINET